MKIPVIMTIPMRFIGAYRDFSNAGFELTRLNRYELDIRKGDFSASAYLDSFRKKFNYARASSAAGKEYASEAVRIAAKHGFEITDPIHGNEIPDLVPVASSV
jgi:hypothetical protein